jgi:hypothetical protein
MLFDEILEIINNTWRYLRRMMLSEKRYNKNGALKNEPYYWMMFVNSNVQSRIELPIIVLLYEIAGISNDKGTGFPRT